MAATVTIDAGQTGRRVSGDRQHRTGTIQLGSYATNGVSVTKSTFDLPVEITDLRVDPASGYIFRWDQSNAKVLAYRENGAGTYTQNQPLTEVGNGVDLSSIVARYHAEGR